MKTYVHIKIFTLMLIAALFQNWKQPKYLSTGEWINKLCYIHITECNSAIKGMNSTKHLKKTSHQFCQTLPKIQREDTSQFILWGRCYSDTKSRLRSHKKRNYAHYTFWLWIQTPSIKYSWPNPTTHTTGYTLWPSSIYSRNTGRFNMQKSIPY